LAVLGGFGRVGNVEAEPLHGAKAAGRRAALFNRAPSGITPNTGQRPTAGGRFFHLWSALYRKIPPDLDPRACGSKAPALGAVGRCPGGLCPLLTGLGAGIGRGECERLLMTPPSPCASCARCPTLTLRSKKAGLPPPVSYSQCVSLSSGGFSAPPLRQSRSAPRQPLSPLHPAGRVQHQP
jgi:hypothetical protein